MKRRTIQSPTGRTVIVEVYNPAHGQGDPRRARQRNELKRAFAPEKVFHAEEEPDYAGLELRLLAAITLEERMKKR